MNDPINSTVWAMRFVTAEWTTVLAPMTTQLCIRDLGRVEHRKIKRPNGAVVNQYRWKSTDNQREAD